MKINEVKEQYKDEWVLAEVLQKDTLNRPVEVRIIIHSKNRDEVYEQLDFVQDNQQVTTFYTGEIPEKGYAVAFYGRRNI